MMICEGLENPLVAKAFVEKEAKAYVGWNTPVTVFHTDLATTCLLHHLLYFPLDAGDRKIGVNTGS